MSEKTNEPLTDERKAIIDAMSIKQMLSKWRFAPIGHFQNGDPESEYFQKVMLAKRAADNAAWVQASKELGW